MGDYAFPCFTLAKTLKKAPPAVAKELASELKPPKGIAEIKALGPYVNFFVEAEDIVKSTLKDIEKHGKDYGKRPKQKNITLIESPGPNTNKPLHLGHLRNMLLGSAIANIQKAIGKDVHIVNVVNDRGVHICKSMLAYQRLGKNDTPEKAKRKSDHFVGDYYVRYSKIEEKDKEKAEKDIQDMLLKWENNDKETRELMKKMNDWALKGFKETYRKLNFRIEKEYYESQTYLGGKDIILGGLKKGIFGKDEEGAIIIDLEKQGLGKKVLLRSNGTSVYITQDINMAQLRYKDFRFNEMIYVVGNEQNHHFKVLFEVFKALRWPFAGACRHFSYGMVELPEGKMKSREGNVVDTDELIEELTKLAKEEVKERYKELPEKEVEKRAEMIAMAAIRFFFLKYDPLRNFVFNPKESLAFEGETGPYLQYTHARICSIMRKAGNKEKKGIDYSLLSAPEEKEVAKHLKDYPDILEKAGRELKPNLICNYLFALSQLFNNYYVKNKVIQGNKELQEARLALIQAVRQVLENGLSLLDIKAPEAM